MDFQTFFVIVGIILLICIAPMLLCMVLCACGFTPAGVAAKSYAAGLQSVIGNVAKGSWFAISQSIMATRFLFNLVGLAIVVATVTIALSVYYFCIYEGEHSAANITSSVGSTLETWRESISNQSVVAINSIPDSFDHLKTYIENANITGAIAGTYENAKSSIADANITSKISDTFENIGKSISNANITSTVSDAFESVKDSISNANITSYISGTFEWFASVSGGSVKIFDWKSTWPFFSIILLKIYFGN